MTAEEIAGDLPVRKGARDAGDLSLRAVQMAAAERHRKSEEEKKNRPASSTKFA